MRAALDRQVNQDFLCALIDDRLDPEVFICKEQSEFAACYDSRIVRLLAALQGQTFRIPQLSKIAAPTLTAWQEAIAQAVMQLHEDNAWPFAKTGQRVSFGLVRITKIRPAIEIARFLADRFPNAYVACYHAADFTIQRFLKEKRLDQLLIRKKGNGHIEADHDIHEQISRIDAPDVKFTVVATPVEEIGRDHDFDWAVIEPSSTQSIVQLVKRQPAVPNAWLSWTREELASAASACGIRFGDAFRLTTQLHEVFDHGFEWDEAFGASRPFSNSE